jgi:hypothetical protein
MIRGISKLTVRPALRQIRLASTAKLPDLPYDFGALEPVISAEIMQIHHQKVRPIPTIILPSS